MLDFVARKRASSPFLLCLGEATMKWRWTGVPLLTLLSVLGSACATAQEVSVVYMNDPLEWREIERPDRQLDREASLMIVVLAPDGSLDTFTGSGAESAEGSGVRVQYSEGYSIWTGSWTVTNGALRIRRRPIYLNVPPVTGYPAWRSDVWKVKGDESKVPTVIDTGQMVLVPTQSLSDVDELLNVIDWRKSHADEP